MEKKYLIEGAIGKDLIASYLAGTGSDHETGAISCFTGQVRSDIIDKRRVKAIEYSAYPEMVAAEAEKIIKLTGDAFPDVRSIEIIHSTGLVPCGGISLLVAVSAGHRDQAMRACRHVVELIKINYPVWKKEIFEDDSHHWRENTPQ